LVPLSRAGSNLGMQMVPLITSFPPFITRIDESGREIGEAYGAKCVSSWIGSGFRPVSANFSGEPSHTLLEQFSIERVNVDRNAKDVVGKPLIYIADMILVANRLNVYGPVVLTNSDILLKLTRQDFAKIAGLKAGQCIVCKRIDVMHADDQCGVVYEHGFDFFVFHSHDLANFPESEFVFGAPWWDHFLPLIMYLRGVKITSLEKSPAYHLTHTERWNQNLWISMGRTFVETIREQYRSGAIFAEDAGRYEKEFENAINGRYPTFLSMLKSEIQRLRRPDRADRFAATLHRLADVNVRWIDRRH
jgi:hypothetical protein